jgi:hypothetical protein
MERLIGSRKGLMILLPFCPPHSMGEVGTTRNRGAGEGEAGLLPSLTKGGEGGFGKDLIPNFVASSFIEDD